MRGAGVGGKGDLLLPFGAQRNANRLLIYLQTEHMLKITHGSLLVE